MCCTLYSYKAHRHGCGSTTESANCLCVIALYNHALSRASNIPGGPSSRRGFARNLLSHHATVVTPLQFAATPARLLASVHGKQHVPGSQGHPDFATTLYPVCTPTCLIFPAGSLSCTDCAFGRHASAPRILLLLLRPLLLDPLCETLATRFLGSTALAPADPRALFQSRATAVAPLVLQLRQT